LDRYRRILGEDHTDTLCTASNFAESLQALGELEAARDLYQDTVDRYRRILGEDHPDVLEAASSLAQVRRELGESP
jgi:Tetratricopeptide repeat